MGYFYYFFYFLRLLLLSRNHLSYAVNCAINWLLSILSRGQLSTTDCRLSSYYSPKCYTRTYRWCISRATIKRLKRTSSIKSSIVPFMCFSTLSCTTLSAAENSISSLVIKTEIFLKNRSISDPFILCDELKNYSNYY